MRVHILGGPGSGKTTLAAELAARLYAPHYDLDRLRMAHLGTAAWIAEAAAIAGQAQWVAEGIHIISVEPLLQRAETIALPETPWPVALWRILRRHVEKTLRGTNPHRTRVLAGFLRFAHDYYVKSIPAGGAAAAAERAFLEEHTSGPDLPSAEGSAGASRPVKRACRSPRGRAALPGQGPRLGAGGQEPGGAAPPPRAPGSVAWSAALGWQGRRARPLPRREPGLPEESTGARRVAGRDERPQAAAACRPGARTLAAGAGRWRGTGGPRGAPGRAAGSARLNPRRPGCAPGRPR
jgi:hypothetical protein